MTDFTPLNRSELREQLGSMLNAAGNGTDGPLLGPPNLVHMLDLAMRGVDLYVEGLLLQAIEQLRTQVSA